MGFLRFVFAGEFVGYGVLRLMARRYGLVGYRLIDWCLLFSSTNVFVGFVDLFRLYCIVFLKPFVLFCFGRFWGSWAVLVGPQRVGLDSLRFC